MAPYKITIMVHGSPAMALPSNLFTWYAGCRTVLPIIPKPAQENRWARNQETNSPSGCTQVVDTAGGGGGQIEPRRDDQISTERQEEGEEAEEEEDEARKGGDGLGVEKSRRLLIVSIRERDRRWD